MNMINIKNIVPIIITTLLLILLSLPSSYGNIDKVFFNNGGILAVYNNPTFLGSIVMTLLFMLCVFFVFLVFNDLVYEKIYYITKLAIIHGLLFYFLTSKDVTRALSNSQIVIPIYFLLSLFFFKNLS